MEQLPLVLTPRLAYRPESYLLHSGVRYLHQKVVNEILQERFSVMYIFGSHRSGKTHFSLRIALDASVKGIYPILVEGADLGREIEELENRSPIGADNLFIVDDVDDYFLGSDFTDSGAFVHLVECLRTRNASLLLMSSRTADSLPVDEHVRSRLLPGEGYVMGRPAEEEMLELLSVMAQQRGIVLKERKWTYLLRRLQLDIPSIERFLDRLLQLSNGQEKTVRYSMLRDALLFSGPEKAGGS